MSDEHYVLTGAPGSGKTAILDALRPDVRCVDEPARRILAEQRRSDGKGTPDRDPPLFLRLLLERSIADHQAAHTSDGPVLFDRGFPDCVAYAILLGADPADAREAALRFRYRNPVFILEPWEAIYRTDDERTMSFADTLPFHDLIVDAYRRAGYGLLIVPRGDVGERARFVLDQMPNS